jgi:hypothetical protein
MSTNTTRAKVVSLKPIGPPPLAPLLPSRARLLDIRDDGMLLVEEPDGRHTECDWLENATTVAQGLAVGDTVLVLPACGDTRAVVLGRVGAYRAPAVLDKLTLETTESLALKCGEASIELRADGKVLVSGQDVLLRAKGTQRIRAGSVAIN